MTQERCEHCSRLVKTHSFDWMFRDKDDDKRPLEKNSKDLVYGVYRRLICFREFGYNEKTKNKYLVNAGTKVANVVCIECWKKGKKFKE